MTDIYRKLDWLSKEDLIKRMVSHEFNRFLDYYRDREEIETATGSERGTRNGERSEHRSSGNHQAEPGYKRLFINLGKMDNFFPSELISLLNKNTRGRIELGRIDLMQKFSFFEVEEKEANNVMKALNRTNWNGRKVSVEIAGDEGKNVPKGRRTVQPEAMEKKIPTARSAATRKTANGTMLPADVETEPKTLQTTRRKAKPSREERGYTKARGKKRRLETVLSRQQ